MRGLVGRLPRLDLGKLGDDALVALPLGMEDGDGGNKNYSQGAKKCDQNFGHVSADPEQRPRLEGMRPLPP